jgi:5-methyltetrahydrofolate--homocysteine methyltransferase
VLNSVFLHEAVEAGLDSAIVNAAKIVPLASVPDDRRKVALDLVWDRREYDADGNLTYDPLAAMLDLFAGVDSAALKDARAAELAALPVGERLERRIIDGEAKGLEADLHLAMEGGLSALDIVNVHLLAGMQVVGERFGSGEMQLPFVLQSAEVMKSAVALLEPHMEKSSSGGKGKMVIATVRGDVHDIGKNLVDIILTNNGYTVVNIGIKQTIAAMIEAAEEHQADVIGMSGLLVKSTVVMRENLEELNARGLAQKYPVLLGGAALTRTYVEDDLDAVYDGQVRYARDAFEGLRLMEPLVRVARGEDVAAVGLPALKKRRHATVTVTQTADEDLPPRSDIASDNPVPTPPFWGSRIVKGIQLADYAAFLDERATFMGQWGLKPSRADDSASYEELVETEGRPRLRDWLDRIKTEDMFDPSVVYGYFPAVADGDDMVILHHEGPDGGSGGAPGAARKGVTVPPPRRAGDRAHALHLPPAAPRPAPVPRGLRPPEGLGRGRRRRLPAGDGGRLRRPAHRPAVRREPVPRVHGAARPLGPAHRVPRRVLALPRPRGARLRSRGPRRPRRHVQGRLPRRPVLPRLPGLPRHGGPPQGDGAAARRARRRRALRRAPAAPRAVDRRDRVPPPGREVLLGVSRA